MTNSSYYSNISQAITYPFNWDCVIHCHIPPICLNRLLDAHNMQWNLLKQLLEKRIGSSPILWDVLMLSQRSNAERPPLKSVLTWEKKILELLYDPQIKASFPMQNWRWGREISLSKTLNEPQLHYRGPGKVPFSLCSFHLSICKHVKSRMVSKWIELKHKMPTIQVLSSENINTKLI